MGTKESKITLLKQTKEYLKWVAGYLNDKLILKVFLQSLPIIWGTVLQIFRSTFYTDEGNLGLAGIIIASVLTSISIFLMIITAVKTKRDNMAKEIIEKDAVSRANEITIRTLITDAEHSIEEATCRQLSSWIEKNKPDSIIRQFAGSLYNSKERISNSMEALKECFAEITQVKKDQFFLSAVFGIENKNSNKAVDWKWLVNPPVPGTLGLRELTRQYTAFREVAINHKPFVYYNDKKEAEANKKYVFDQMDGTYDKKGSIICCEFAERIKHFDIRLILNISTYGQHIVNNDADEEYLKDIYVNRIRNIILKQFEGEIRENILWYALQTFDFVQGKYFPNN